MNKIILLSLAIIISPLMLSHAQAAAINNEIMLIAKSDLDDEMGERDRDRDMERDRDMDGDMDRDRDMEGDMDRDRDRDHGESDDGMVQKSKQKSKQMTGEDDGGMEQERKEMREQNMKENQGESKQEGKSWWKFWQ